MRDWNNRAKEIAYLLNPAFCGRLLYCSVKYYDELSKRSFPFPLIYLILPLILHKKTRNRISSRTQLMFWLQQNQDLLIGFSERAKSLVPITNEALEFLLQSGIVRLTNNAEIELTQAQRALSKTKFINDEIKDCIAKSENVAKWFASAGKVETIYISLGVKP